MLLLRRMLCMLRLGQLTGGPLRLRPRRQLPNPMRQWTQATPQRALLVPLPPCLSPLQGSPAALLPPAREGQERAQLAVVH